MVTAKQQKPETVSDQTLASIEALTGHLFNDRKRLARALTHASARSSTGADYERLEFLGDRVLGLCVAEMLFAQYRDANEGELSVRLNALVNADVLAEIAEEMSLVDFIRAGEDVADLTSARQKNVRADVVESLIAAIYLENGLQGAKHFVNRYWEERILRVAEARRDSKTELQEWSHKNHRCTPSYSVVDRSGPDHEPVFVVKVVVADKLFANGTGPSKRVAEQDAARELLEDVGVWERLPGTGS
ncbi:MAG: ribonuclease III [Pseudomonadota bacterium]